MKLLVMFIFIFHSMLVMGIEPSEMEAFCSDVENLEGQALEDRVNTFSAENPLLIKAYVSDRIVSSGNIFISHSRESITKNLSLLTGLDNALKNFSEQGK